MSCIRGLIVMLLLFQFGCYQSSSMQNNESTDDTNHEDESCNTEIWGHWVWMRDTFVNSGNGFYAADDSEFWVIDIVEVSEDSFDGEYEIYFEGDLIEFGIIQLIEAEDEDKYFINFGEASDLVDTFYGGKSYSTNLTSYDFVDCNEIVFHSLMSDGTDSYYVRR